MRSPSTQAFASFLVRRSLPSSSVPFARKGIFTTLSAKESGYWFRYVCRIEFELKSPFDHKVKRDEDTSCVAKKDFSIHSCRGPKGAKSTLQYVWNWVRSSAEILWPFRSVRGSCFIVPAKS